MAFSDEILERLDALEAQGIGLKDLPMKAVADWLDLNHFPRGAEAVMPHSIGPSELAPFPHGRMRATSHANINLNTITFVTFTTEVFDHGDMVNIAAQPTRLTIPLDGVYIVTANFRWGINGTNNAREAWIDYNGGGGASTSLAYDTRQAGATQVAHPLASVSRLKRGDYLRLGVYAENTTAVEASTTGGIFLAACWISHYSPDAAGFGA